MVSLWRTQHTDTRIYVCIYIDHVYCHSPCYHLLQQLVYFLVLVGPLAIAMSSFLFLLSTQDKTQFHVFRNYRYHYTTSLRIEVVFNISMTKKNLFENISHYFPTSFMLSKWFLHFCNFSLYLLSLKMSTVFRRIDWIHLALQFKWW